MRDQRNAPRAQAAEKACGVGAAEHTNIRIEYDRMLDHPECAAGER